jgi:diphthamide biosynthesis enzyme Dph1/Dph2-like protein
MDITDLQDKYDIEIECIIAKIKKDKPGRVLIQLPDGLKQYATQIIDLIEKEVETNISIWLGTCFGACDKPNTDADLVIQFGHAPWGKKEFNEME